MQFRVWIDRSQCKFTSVQYIGAGTRYATCKYFIVSVSEWESMMLY